ncbi:L,D-transpeptidase family protein [soil metagenome]
MNRGYLRLKHGLFCLSFLLLLASCNRNKSSRGVGGEANQASEVTVDSLFIRDYLAAEPQLKEQSELVYLFYGDREYKMGWFRNGKLIPEAQRFLEAVDESSQDGLNPEEYKVKDFGAMFEQLESLKKRDSTRIALQKEIDVALTASYFNFASDFYRGKVDPREVDHIDWSVKRNKIKLHKALQTILRERDSRYPYYQFEALHDGYRQLRTALAQYRQIQEQGGWPRVPSPSKPLKLGDSAEVVPVLRQRLFPASEANAMGEGAYVYDEKLEQAVKGFQIRHGLNPDGSLGGETLKMMNIPVEDRIDQILLNMERWRWVPKRFTPKELPDKYLFVNIPEYKLHVMEEGQEVLDMRVIVGKTMHSTPVFSDKLEYVVMAPYWNVPVSIVVNELKPKLINNPNFLESQDMELVDLKTKAPMSPSSIDWSSVTEDNFTHLIRQRPGPKNSLGLVKFLFPNEYNVYLHDTPTGSLFNLASRGFSHGCVRVEEPLKLANYLLNGHPEWNEQMIRETMNGGEETWVTLEEKVPVYIVYFTAWIDKNGAVHFRDDIYGHDQALAREYFD